MEREDEVDTERRGGTYKNGETVFLQSVSRGRSVDELRLGRTGTSPMWRTWLAPITTLYTIMMPTKVENEV